MQSAQLPGIALIWMLAGTAAVLGWYAASWWLSGRDPAPGMIAPRWSPPEGITPAEAVYLDALVKGHVPDEYRAFMAFLTSLAAKGHVMMDRVLDQLLLIRLKSADASLPPEEGMLMDQLFARGESVVLNNTRRGAERIRTMIGLFSHAMQRRITDRFLNRNRVDFLVGIALAAITYLGFLYFGASFFRQLDPDILPCFLIITLALASLYPFLWNNGMRNGSIRKRKHAIHMFFLAFSAFFVVLAILVCSGASMPFGWYVALFLGVAVMPTVIAAAWYLLPRPSQTARQLFDDLEGLRMFIRTTSRRDTYQPLHSAMPRSELLPWAIALGEEQQLPNAFRDWLQAAGEGRESDRFQEALASLGVGNPAVDPFRRPTFGVAHGRQ